MGFTPVIIAPQEAKQDVFEVGGAHNLVCALMANLLLCYLPLQCWVYGSSQWLVLERRVFLAVSLLCPIPHPQTLSS